MKKLFYVFMLALIVLSVVALAACDNNSDETFAEGDELTLVIGYDEPQEIAIDLNGISREVTLPELFTATKIEYEIVDGFLTSVGDLAPEPPVYIHLYTSVKSDFDTSEYAETITYNDTELCSSGVGANIMSIVPGSIIYIGTRIY